MSHGKEARDALKGVWVRAGKKCGSPKQKLTINKVTAWQQCGVADGLYRGNKLLGTNMKNVIKLAIISAVIAVGILQSQAAAAAKTNWTQNINIMLRAWEDGSTKPTAITTKSVLVALGHPLSSAKLLLVQSAGGTKFIIRDGKTDTDVTSHFSRTQGTLVASTTTGAVTTKRSVDGYHVDGTNLSLDIGGFTVEARGPVVKNGVNVTKSLNAKVAGQGIVGTGTTANVVLEGTISVNGGRLE